MSSFMGEHQDGIKALLGVAIDLGPQGRIEALGRLNAALAPWDDPSVIIDVIKDECEQRGWLVLHVDPQDAELIPGISTKTGGFVLGIQEIGIETHTVIPVRYCVFGPTGFYVRDVYWAMLEPGKHAKKGPIRTWLGGVVKMIKRAA